MICGAIGFALHIVLIGIYAPDYDPLKLIIAQLYSAAAGTAILMFIFEEPSLTQLALGWKPLLYATVCATSIPYICQFYAQTRITPAVTGLLLSMESVFSVLAGLVILGQLLSGREVFGCILVFCAIIAAQIPFSKRERAAIEKSKAEGNKTDKIE